MKKLQQMPKILCAVTGLTFSVFAQAQNASYNANTVPIGGSSNSAFGSGALTSVTGAQNAAIGRQAMSATTSGRDNAVVGFRALYSNTTGSYNAAVGSYALQANTSGRYNAALGYQALQGNTAENNTAIGFRSLYNNTVGADNTASGFAALHNNISGNNNVANGFRALASNNSGNNNAATGSFALYSNFSGVDNVANGLNTLYNNTSGSWNTASGAEALKSNTTAWYNTAHGAFALVSNTTGSENVASGVKALGANTTGTNNTASGYGALNNNNTGDNNTALGSYADVNAAGLSNATAIGNGAIADASNKVRIGNTAVTVIEGQVAYSFPSDGRFKTNIKEDDVKGLEFIKKLRPVVYNFDTRKFTEFLTKNMSTETRQRYLDQDFSTSTKVRQSGFIAQEVEQAAKAVQYDFNGVHVPANAEEENYSIAYSEFVVPLVKAVQEQQRIIETLQQQVNELLQEKSSSPTDLEESTISNTSMEQNVPNPFTYETVIGFNLPQSVSNASLVVYDLSGKQLKSLLIQQRGNASMTITADQLAAGMYIYSIVADGKLISSKRMVVAEK